MGTPVPVFADSGRALVAWPSGDLRLGSWQPGGAVRPAGRFGGYPFEPPLRVGAHRVVLPIEAGPPERPRLSVAVVGISGRILQKPRRVRSFRGAVASGAAAGPGGEAAIAWVEPYGGLPRTRLRLRLSLRRPGGAFGRARVVTGLGEDDHPGPAAVGVAYSGRRLVLAFTLERAGGRRQVHALIGRPGRWRRQVLGLHRGIADMAVTANRAGRVVAAWQTQDGGEEGNKPSEVRAAILEPRARRFARTRLLDPGAGIGRWPGEIAGAVARDGTVALSWSQVGKARDFPVVVTTAPPGGGFGPLTTVDANGAAGDVAFAADGRLLVTWGRITRGNYQHPDQVFAAQRDARATAFGAAEAISEDVGVMKPNAAVDPASGRFVIGWTLAPAYPSQDPMRPRLSVRGRAG